MKTMWHNHLDFPWQASWYVWRSVIFKKSGLVCNIGHSSETHLKLKSPDNSFPHNTRVNDPFVLKFDTEHDSITAVFRNDCTNF